MVFFLFSTIGCVVSSNDAVSSYYGATQLVEGTENTLGKLFQPNMAMVLTVALSFGISIMVLVYNFAYISGGHLNPAVTLSMIIFGEVNPIRGVIYIVVQSIGAILGVVLVGALFPARNCLIVNYGANALDKNLTLGQGFFLEFLGTAMLCFTVFSTAVDSRNSKFTHRMAPLVIGFAVFLMHILLIPMTGCGINPARSLATAVVSGKWDKHWVYWVAPMTGGPFGAALQYFFFQFKNSDQEHISGRGTGIMGDGIDEDEQGKADNDGPPAGKV